MSSFLRAVRRLRFYFASLQSDAARQELEELVGAEEIDALWPAPVILRPGRTSAGAVPR